MPLLRIPAALALPLLAGLLVTGCFGVGPIPCTVGVVRRAPASEVEPYVFAQGEQVALQLLPAAVTAQQCDGTPQLRPDTVRVTVVDGQNRPVEASSRLERDGSAQVEFVPQTPGAYHVSVLFEPAGGLLQREVLVATDRTQTHPLSLPAACTQLQRTAAGTWVCDGRVFRDGQELTPLPSGRVLVAGNSVWVADGQGVVRLEDTGSGPLEERGSLARGVQPTDALVADAQRLVRLTTTQLEAIFVSGDGLLQSPGSTSLPASGIKHLMLTGDAVLLMAPENVVTPTPGTADGGIAGSGAGTQVCVAALSPTAPPVASTACQRVRGQVVALEADAVWTQEPSASGPDAITLHHHRLAERTLALTTSLMLSARTSLALPGADVSAGFIPSAQWVVPHQQGLDLGLERYRTVGRGPLRAHTGHAWQPDEDTTTVWLR